MIATALLRRTVRATDRLFGWSQAFEELGQLRGPEGSRAW